jgi:hypothetical protein
MAYTFSKLRDYCMQNNVNVTQHGRSSEYSVPDVMMKGFALMELDSARERETADIEMAEGNNEDSELRDKEGEPEEENLWVELD